jgi:hypothetical protein
MLVETIESRKGLAVGRIVLQSRSPGLDGAARIAQDRFAQLTEAPAQLAARGGVVFQADFDAQDLGEVTAVASTVNAFETPACR